MDESRIFEVTGNLWDYGKIATVSTDIAEDFLKKLGISALESLLSEFKKDISDTGDGVLRSVDLLGSNSFFIVKFEESSDVYQFNDKSEIVDWEGKAVPPDFYIDNCVSLSFRQRTNPVNKYIPIPIMQAGEVMEFVKEVCKKHEGISPPYGPNEVTESLVRKIGIISGVQFDEIVYGLGKGPVKVRLNEYSEILVK